MYPEIKKEIESFGFSVVSSDFNRPWGGFLAIEETQAQDFSNKFFEGIDFEALLQRKIVAEFIPKLDDKDISVNFDTEITS